jgi:hypothetical protein
MTEAKPKWFDDWFLEIKGADSYGMCDITIRLPHSATDKKIFRVRCSTKSEVSELVMLLDCALYELSERDKK